MPDQDDAGIWITVEIPRRSRNKYEYDHQSGRIKLDRTLHSSVQYPTDYGFIPDTTAPTGEAMDVLVVVEEPSFPGCLVQVRVIGLLEMRSKKGQDPKILAVPVGDARFDEIRDLNDLPEHWLREIEAFFATYKLLEGDDAEVGKWRGRQDAERAIAQARRAPAGGGNRGGT